MHQRNLALLPFFEQYDLVREPYRRSFATSQRALPTNIRMVDDFKPGYYDFALLHLDQQSLWNEGESESVKGDSRSKSRAFNELKATIKELEPDLPIIVINHMTPFHDTYETHKVIAKCKKKMEGCDLMICNSFTAAQQWGFGHVITHGLHIDEWDLDVEHFKKTGEKIGLQKEPRCSIVMSPAGMEKAYKREFAREVVRRLGEYGVPTVWVGVTQGFKFGSFDEYRDFVGRSLVHFFPAWQSPRPRARTEAMLSGNCIVTTPYQDADTFFNSGKLVQKKNAGGSIIDELVEYDDDTNGFLTSFSSVTDPRTIGNPEYVADLIRFLILERPDIALKVGKKGQEFARENFHEKIFEEQWRDLLISMKIL